MEITFRKTGPRAYETLVSRDDGVVLRVPSPDRPAALPHDIAHYLVERELGLERGFWGCVAAGAVFDNIEVVSGRQRPHAAVRSKEMIKAARTQLATSELYALVLLGVAHERREADWPLVVARLDEVWRPFREPRRPVSAEEAVRVCRALREAEERWLALPVGGCLAVPWEARRGKARRRGERVF